MADCFSIKKALLEDTAYSIENTVCIPRKKLLSVLSTDWSVFIAFPMETGAIAG